MIEAWVASHPKQDMPPLMRAAAAALNAWKAKRPTHRAIAQFREEAAITLCERDYDWFTELLEDKTFVSTFAPIYGQKRRIDAQTALSAWVSRKLRAVSQTSNWFRPSEGLTYNLLATDLRGAVVGDLKLPMPAFYIELPPGVVYLEDALTGWHSVRTLVVITGLVTEKTFQIAQALGDPDADKLILGKRLVIETYGDPNENSSNPFDDTWMFKSYIIGQDEEDVEKAVTSTYKVEWERALNRGRVGDRVVDGLELRSLLFKFVLNFCIYLGTDRATVTHAHEGEIKRLHGGKKFKALRKPVQEKIRRLQDDRVFDVGTDVQINPEIRQAVRTEGAGGHQLTYRTLVRGHWRNQAHGPARLQRKRMWIEPHIRGQELPTKVVGHNYDVK